MMGRRSNPSVTQPGFQTAEWNALYYDGAEIQPLRYTAGFPDCRMNERHSIVAVRDMPLTLLGDDNEDGNEVELEWLVCSRQIHPGPRYRARVSSKVNTSNLLINGVSNLFLFHRRPQPAAAGWRVRPGADRSGRADRNEQHSPKNCSPSQ